MSRIISMVALVIITVYSPYASAQHKAGALEIDGAHSLELPPVSSNGAAYFRIMNRGQQPERLLSVSTPIAERAELHDHEMSGGMMKMRKVPTVRVPAEASVEFAPGGLHVMLMGLKRPLVAGDRFPLTLSFERAGAVVLDVHVRPRGHAGESAPGGHAGDRKHSGQSR